MTDSLVEQQRRLVQQAQQGDAEALAELRGQCQAPLLSILRSRGAGETEAEEILADLWSDCVPGAGKACLLAKFNGQAAPLGWLARVAINRWIDARRRRAKFDSQAEVDLDELPAGPAAMEDHSLQAALRESLQAAFAGCSPAALLTLRLVYLHGITQREIGRMLGWTESKTSRTVSQALAQIEQQTLKQLEIRHPHLELAWDDLVALCASREIDFL